VGDGLVWRTCLRSIEFLDEPADVQPVARATLRDTAAYRFLLEVICGLHSPLVGETQVHGQFKTFADGLDPRQHGPEQRLAQQLLADAKAVREAHLRSLGARTYGSAVRRWVRDCDRVALVGSGALASELRPYLAAGRTLDCWSRHRPEPAPDATTPVTWRRLDDASGTAPRPGAAAVVVAAPVASGVIESIARCYPSCRRVVDLRGNGERAAVHLDVPVVTLEDVFLASAGSPASTDERIDAARRDIDGRARAWFARAELHPHGWEDVCG